MRAVALVARRCSSRAAAWPAPRVCTAAAGVAAAPLDCAVTSAEHSAFRVATACVEGPEQGADLHAMAQACCRHTRGRQGAGGGPPLAARPPRP